MVYQAGAYASCLNLLHRLPLCLERYVKQMSLYPNFFICNRLSDRHASTRSGSAICVQRFTDSCNSHYISQLPCYFNDSRAERISTESRLSLLDIQTQLNFQIANVQQNSFKAETNLIQRRLASTLKWPHYMLTSSEIQLNRCIDTEVE